MADVRDPAVQEMLDKVAIREVTMRYCRGCDRGDADLVSSCYHPDARDDRGQVLEGDDIGQQVVDQLEQIMQSTSHHIGTQTIEIYGDAAGAETYSIGNHVLKDGQRLRSLTRYVDRFEKRDGEWRILSRLVLNDATELLPAQEGPSLGGESPARRDPTDPSYAAFTG